MKLEHTNTRILWHKMKIENLFWLHLRESLENDSDSEFYMQSKAFALFFLQVQEYKNVVIGTLIHV